MVEDNVIKEIAGLIDCGLICHLNLLTMQLKYYSKEEEYEDFPSEIVDDVLLIIEKDSEDWMQIDPLESGESYRIMEDFAYQMEDEKFQVDLFNALNKSKPFRNFKWLIDNSDYRQNWFDFKAKKLFSHVKLLIALKLSPDGIVELNENGEI
ncbi:MAG: UPF0158 family protein [Salinivirgaceae bacterium]|jgi:hypothetical protein|nr:UPF0158 family protein [Salinivirgaceae bacterium]